MISHKGVGEGSHSYQDTRSEVGVTSVITPLPLGEGKGEGPTGAGGEVSLGLLIPPNKRAEGEVELFLKTKEEP